MNEKIHLELDESLYATLRIITIFLTVDGSVKSRELDWFKWLIQNRVKDSSYMTVLTNDLLNPPKLEELLGQVIQSDRKRLIAWARIAISVDGQISPAENKLFECLLKLNEQTDFETSHQALGRAVLESHNRAQFWTELTDWSDYIRRPLRLREIFFHNWIIFNGIMRGNKLIIGLLIFFMLVTIVVRILL